MSSEREPETDGTLKEEELPPAPDLPTPQKGLLPSGPRGLVLSSLDDMWRFANYVVKAGLAPKGFETAAGVLIALQMGAELGLPPMASLQNICVINRRPSVYGDVQLAVCQTSPVWDDEAFVETYDSTTKTASCTVRRLPKGQPVTRTFSEDDAKVGRLHGKEGPWTNYPKRMLQMRARGFALRDAFAPELKGFRSVEEVRDDDYIDLPPESVREVSESAGKSSSLEDQLSQKRAEREREKEQEQAKPADPPPATETKTPATTKEKAAAKPKKDPEPKVAESPTSNEEPKSDTPEETAGDGGMSEEDRQRARLQELFDSIEVADAKMTFKTELKKAFGVSNHKEISLHLLDDAIELAEGVLAKARGK